MDPRTDDAGALYARCRTAVSEVVRPLDARQLAMPVPACPGWTVHDVVAHLAGVATDAINGVPARPSMDEWTAQHVEQRRDRPTKVVLREWERSASQFEVVLAKDPMSLPAAVMDVLCHEHDVRGAIGQAGRRGAAELVAAADGLAARWLQRLDSAVLDPVALVDADGRRWAGPEGAPVTLRAGRFELFRATFGRRSRAQVARRLSGIEDPDAHLDHLFIFGPATDDLVE